MSDSATGPTPEPLTAAKLQKLRERIDGMLDYALIMPSLGVKGTDCLKLERNDLMPPGCRYALFVAPDKLALVVQRLNARVSTRFGVCDDVYEFYVSPR